MKDMPSEETKGLLTNCFLERNDPREVLISNNKLIKDLKVIVGNKYIITDEWSKETFCKGWRYGEGKALDIRERAPSKSHRDMYLNEEGEVMKNKKILLLETAVSKHPNGRNPLSALVL